MKHVYVIILLVALSIKGFGQISPELKTGFGYVYVLDEDMSTSPDYHTITGYPTFLVEKPFPIEIRMKKRLSINPGLAYYFFKEALFIENPPEEVDIKRDLPFTRDSKINHQSVNAYVKVLYQAKFAGKTEAFIYAGGLGGINFFTKTIGTRTDSGVSVQSPEYTIHINENGRDFFELFYYGALVGFQPNARKYNFIKPSFEIAYYPGFVSKKNYETSQITYNGINTIQFTVLLGFRIK